MGTQHGKEIKSSNSSLKINVKEEGKTIKKEAMPFLIHKSVAYSQVSSNPDKLNSIKINKNLINKPLENQKEMNLDLDVTMLGEQEAKQQEKEIKKDKTSANFSQEDPGSNNQKVINSSKLYPVNFKININKTNNANNNNSSGLYSNSTTDNNSLINNSNNNYNKNIFSKQNANINASSSNATATTKDSSSLITNLNATNDPNLFEIMKKTYGNILPSKEFFNPNPSKLLCDFIPVLNPEGNNNIEHSLCKKSNYIKSFKECFGNSFKVYSNTFPHIFINHLITNCKAKSKKIKRKKEHKDQIKEESNRTDIEDIQITSHNSQKDIELFNDDFINNDKKTSYIMKSCIRNRFKLTTIVYYTPNKKNLD